MENIILYIFNFNNKKIYWMRHGDSCSNLLTRTLQEKYNISKLNPQFSYIKSKTITNSN